VLGEAIAEGATISGDAILTGVLTFFTALAAIAFLMAIVKRYSLASFVIYRIILGVLLLYLVYTGFFAAAA
jgi:undecaprenyl-diphosphatase